MLSAEQQAERLASLVLEIREVWEDEFSAKPGTWRLALRTALAREETCAGPAPHRPALPADVYAAELDEIRCRKTLRSKSFLHRAWRLADLAPSGENIDHAGLKARIEADIVKHGGLLQPQEPSPEEGDRLMGLAFSGGGIRSATFNLGVLQALSRLKILEQFDYLSTVSGGGYIGAWFAAWVKRALPEQVGDALDPECTAEGVGECREPIHFLREYSNYLTPRLGLLSGDTWAVVSIYLRNTLLNLITLISFLSFLLLLPRVFLCIQTHWGPAFSEDRRRLYGLFYVAVAVPLIFILLNLRGFSCKPPRDAEAAPSKRPWYGGRTKSVTWLIAIPIVFAAILGGGHMFFVRSALTGRMDAIGHLNYGLVKAMAGLLIAVGLMGLVYFPVWQTIKKTSLWKGAGTTLAAAIFCGLVSWYLRSWVAAQFLHRPLWMTTAAAIAALLWSMGWLGGFYECFLVAHRAPTGAAYLLWYGLGAAMLAPAAAFTGYVAAQLLVAIAAAFRYWEPLPWLVTIWSVPLLIADVSLVAYLFIGMMGKYFPDERREWISRLAGMMLLISLGWAGLSVAAFYCPPGLRLIYGKIGAVPAKTLLTAVWSVITWASVQAARSPKTSENQSRGGSGLEPMKILAEAGPYVFIVGLVTLLAGSIESILRVFDPHNPRSYLLMQQHWRILGPAAVCLGVAMLFSFTVDVNEFSMHHFYRNRLVRAYLGASRQRCPNGFSGFDSRDDVALARFAPSQTTPGMEPYLGPYPIFNTALNLTSGEELAYQERQAESFIFTPRFCGAGTYRPTLEYAYPPPGIHLGSAMAISGAAMSPNQGFHSSPAVAFLLTIFNVRLGWWLGNPRLETNPKWHWFWRRLSDHLRGQHWQRSSPWQGLAYLLKELSGTSNDQSGYVYLSDGGHFDNLGLYELVKRKCRFIVVCDAEEDAAFGFEGLGNAIRKCRADQGVEIDIDVEQIKPRADSRLSRWHCVVGKIHYEHSRNDVKPGILVYLKSSLTGDEPSDLLEYSLRRPEFPHQTTLDQFFDESQFESYRRLGYHVGVNAFKAALEDVRRDLDVPEGLPLNPEDLFHMMAVKWYPPSPDIERAFTRHAEEFSRLQNRLRNDKKIRFLQPQFYPEWNQLLKVANRFESAPEAAHAAGESGSRKVDPLWIPDNAAQVRAGFFYCSRLIQLMENVYLDLNLERYQDHPDNQGWINLFRHWSYSGMFQVTWSVSASMYGSRFSLFCERSLQMSIGKVTILDVVPEGTAPAVPFTGFEEKRIGEIRGQDAYSQATVHQLAIQVDPDADSRADPFQFAFGVLMIQDRKIVYLRVRRHLRRFGLGRRTLQEAFRRKLIAGRPLVADGKPLDSISAEDWKRLLRLVESTRPSGT